MPNQRIPLLVAFTPSYIIPAATMLRSVLNHTDHTDRFDVICMLSEPIDDKYRSLLDLIDCSGRLSFRYLDMSDSIEGAYIDPKYTAAANYRLVVADLIPEYNKAIYLDCDIIVRQDLTKLYREVDLGDCYMAGIVEASTTYQISRFEPLGCEAGQYINSGFLLMNLELLRRDKMSERFLEALRVPYLEFPDQDAINLVCKNRLKHLSPLYNGIRTFMLPAYKKDFIKYYPSSLWAEVRRSATLHYTGEKPWRAYTLYFEEWWRVYWTLPHTLRNAFPHDVRIERLARFFTLPGVRPLVNVVLTLKSKL